MQRIAILDLGMGNLRSVERALDRAAKDIGLEVEIAFARAPEMLAGFDKIVFPGQGAFRDAAAGLARGFGDALGERIDAGTPFFGICLGLQALFEASDESPGAYGLGFFEGRVVRIPDGAREPSNGAPVKVPHMGWNQLEMWRRGAGPLASYDAAPPFVYFVHSYYAVPGDPSIIAATAHHGPYVITAAVQRDNVTATQFHPEKSQKEGLRLLAAFLKS